jgi:Brp/Blh family beta-carotene 15,15'-monooxygenase
VNKVRYTQIYLSVCGLAILATLTGLAMPPNSLTILLLIAVIILGLPHGALDFALAKSMKLMTSGTSALSFVSLYIAIAAVSIIFWLWSPSAALVIFLAVSVFHFSADWRAILPISARLGMAGALLCGPAIFYPSALVTIFSALMVPTQDAALIIYGMKLTFMCGGLLLLGGIVRSVLGRKLPKTWQGAEWLIILTSSIVLTPLLHFGLYFCLLHSPKHFQDISDELGLSTKRAFLVSLPFVLLTIFLGIFVFMRFGNEGLNVNFLRLIFIGLFGLTMSHMLLVHLWHKSS